MTKAERFKLACKKYLTPLENKEFTYKQKVSMVNFGAKEQLGDVRYNQLKAGKVDVENIGITDSELGMLVDDLPLDDISKQIIRYRVQKYTHREIYELMNIKHSTYYELLADIQAVVGDNMELLEVEHETIHKKSPSYNE